MVTEMSQIYQSFIFRLPKLNLFEISSAGEE